MRKLSSKIDYHDVKQRYENGESLRQIAKDYGVAHSTVYNILNNTGAEVRDKSEAQKSFLKGHDHQRKGQEHKISTRKKISDQMKKRYEESQKGDLPYE